MMGLAGAAGGLASGAFAGRSRLCRGGGGAVPAAGRGLHVHRLLGRRVDREGLHRELGGDERLLVDARRNVVPLLGRVLVALVGGEREPLVGLGEVLFDADAAGIQDAEIVLAVGDAAVGGLAEPLRRDAVVRLAVDAFGVEHRQIVDRLGVALVGGLQVERTRLVEVLLHALALLVQAAEAVLRGREAVIGGAL